VTSFPDGGELGELLAQMQQLQETVAQAEAAAGSQTVEGTAAGGAVRVQVSGDFSFDAVRIDPAVVDPTDVSLLEDLVLAAIRDAVTRLTEVRRAAMGDVVGSALAGLFGADEGDAYDAYDDEPDDTTGGSGDPELPS
jgi:DNA-binding YbaB/EbfC family protein